MTGSLDGGSSSSTSTSGLPPPWDRPGLAQPIAVWIALALLSIGGTWLISTILEPIRSPFRHPATWLVLGGLTLSIGLVPGVPPLAVLVGAWTIGLGFAARHDELARLILGPPVAEVRPDAALNPGDRVKYALRLALAVVILGAPEAFRRLPPRLGGSAAGPVEGQSAPSDPSRGR